MITSQVGGRPTVTCFCLHTPIFSTELLELLGPKGVGNDHLSSRGKPTVTCFCLRTAIVNIELLELLGYEGARNDHLLGGGQPYTHS
jgi:hypothetical protein